MVNDAEETKNFSMRMKVRLIDALKKEAKREYLPLRTMITKWLYDELERRGHGNLYPTREHFHDILQYYEESEG